MKKIVILDYGLGNIRSLYNSIKIVNHDVTYFSETKKKHCDILFIPGVGSFAKASNIFKEKGYFEIIKKAKDEGVIIVGICLGMHILFSEGFEDGHNKGLDFINGKVEKIKNKILKLPNIGWKEIKIEKNIEKKFFDKFNNNKFYFVHSYMAIPKDSKNIIGSFKYENIKIPSIVSYKNIIGIQFHPEKSGEIGIELIKEVIKNY